MGLLEEEEEDVGEGVVIYLAIHEVRKGRLRLTMKARR